jgi:hypothetical protein
LIIFLLVSPGAFFKFWDVKKDLKDFVKFLFPDPPGFYWIRVFIINPYKCKKKFWKIY